MMKFIFIVCLLFSSIFFLNAQGLIGEFSGTAESENLGSQVSLSQNGNVLAIAAKGFGDNQGQVQVFKLIEGQWEQQGESLIGHENAILGRRVVLSPDGSRIMVKSLVQGESSGQVQVYEWKEDDWTQLGATLKIDQPLDLFGDGLAFSGDGSRIVIGSPQEHGEVETQVGSVRIFDLKNGNWEQVGSKLHGNKQWDYMGTAVDLSEDGNRVAFSVHGLDADGLDGNGAIRVHEFNGSDWEQVGSDISASQEKAKFGRTSVKISADGKKVAVSGDWYGENGELFWGIVEVYELDGNEWNVIGTFKGNKGNWLGTAMDFSDDGNTLLIGSMENFVRLYRYEGGEWIQKGDDFTHDEASARFGQSLALSGNGNVIAIGADRYDAITNDEGITQVFDVSEISTSLKSNIHESLSIFPNPFTNQISLGGLDNIHVDKLKFYDLYGRELYLMKNPPRIIELPFHAKGVLHLQLYIDGQVVTRKLIKM